MTELRPNAAQRITAFVVALALAITLLPGGIARPLEVEAAGDVVIDLSDTTTYDVNNITGDALVVIKASDTGKNFHIKGNGTTTIPASYSTYGRHGILVETGYVGTITLEDVDLRTQGTDTTVRRSAAMLIQGDLDNTYNSLSDVSTQVTLNLVKNNTLWSGEGSSYSDRAGLEVWAGAMVTITGGGSLHAQSGELDSGNSVAAAIGGGASKPSAHTNAPHLRGGGGGGHIVIESGNITAATGGHGAAIGGSMHSSAIGTGIGYCLPANETTNYQLDEYTGTILIYGGNIKTIVWGNEHGFGIGSGCTTFNVSNKGTVVAVPPAAITSTTTNPSNGNRYLGGLDTRVYIGDPKALEHTVYTEDNTKNSDIYIDITHIEELEKPLKLAPGLNGKKLWLGKTDSVSGEHEFKAEFNVPVTFFTDEKVDGKNFTYLPVETTSETDGTLTKIMLPRPYMPFYEYNPKNSDPVNDLTFGYTEAEAEAAVGKIRILNNGVGILDSTLTEFKINAKDTDLNNHFIVTYEPSTFDIDNPRLLPGEDVTFTLQLRQDKAVNESGYIGKFLITGVDKVKAEVVTDELEVKQRVNKFEGQHGDIVVTADENKIINAHSQSSDTQIKLELKNQTLTSAKYQLTTNQSTHPGSFIGAENFIVGSKAIEFGSLKGTYYLHWEVETPNVISKSSNLGNKVFGPYYINKERPTATVTLPTAVNEDSFTATITFDKPVAGLTSSDLDLSNVIIVTPPYTTSSAVPGGIAPTTGNSYYTDWAVVLKAVDNLNMGEEISVQIKESAALDDHNNQSIASAKKTLKFNTKSPEANFSFTENQKYIDAVPASFDVIIVPQGIDTEDLYLDDTGNPAQAINNASKVPNDLITITGKKSGIVGSYTIAALSKTSEGWRITVNLPAGMDDDDIYTVSLAEGKVYNSEGNDLKDTFRAFEIRVPRVTKVEVDPHFHNQPGGDIKVTVTGQNLTGVLDLIESKVLNGVTENTAERIVSVNAAGTEATYSAKLEANNSVHTAEYTFEARINGGLTGEKDTVDVGAATPKVDTFTADPTSRTYKGGSSTLSITGEHLNNYTNLLIKHVESGSEYHLTGLPVAATTADYEVILPANTLKTPVVYTYKLYDGATDLNKTVTVTVGPATPGLNSSNALEVDPESLGNEGGDVDFYINGENLHNYEKLEIYDHNRGIFIPINEINALNELATAEDVLPGNRDLDDVTYIFEIYVSEDSNPSVATGHRAEVVVEGSKPVVESVTASPVKHSAQGGTSLITINGKYLDNATALKLVETVDTDSSFRDEHVVTDISTDPDATSATISLGFSGNIGPRNDIHLLEAYLDDEDTGESATVEVGDSLPYVDGASASPDEFTREETLYGRGRSVISITGGYLYNFDSLELYDTVNQQYYTVTAREPDDDREATHTVTVPSNNGVYTYQVHADGTYTGYDAEIRVGVGLGYSPPPDEEEKPPKEPGEKEYKGGGAGGGHKGGGFTGAYNGYDFVFHHVKQSVLKDGEDAYITLQNVWYISQEQMDFAASGAREAARNGTVHIHFDTTDPDDSKVLEGRIVLNPFDATKDIYPGICTCEDEVEGILLMFQSQFGVNTDRLAGIRLEQNAEYGVEVEVVANVDLEGMDTDNLKFYRYDRQKGEYSQIKNPDYEIDHDGLLHFNTKAGGNIIVTDQPVQVADSSNAASAAAVDRKDEDTTGQGDEE